MDKDVIYIHRRCDAYIYAMEFYFAIKKNEILPFATTWTDLEGIILSETRKEGIMLSEMGKD